MAERYIVIPKWDEFQHYKGQDRPKWIKLYTRLHHDDDFLQLPEGTRMLLVHLWLETASARARLRLDTSTLARRFNMRVTSAQLKRLEQAGFIRIVSRRTLEKLYSNSSPDKKEIRKETPLPPFHLNGKSKSVCPECSIGGGLHLADCNLAQKVSA